MSLCKFLAATLNTYKSSNEIKTDKEFREIQKCRDTMFN